MLLCYLCVESHGEWKATADKSTQFSILPKIQTLTNMRRIEERNLLIKETNVRIFWIKDVVYRLEMVDRRLGSKQFFSEILNLKKSNIHFLPIWIYFSHYYFVEQTKTQTCNKSPITWINATRTFKFFGWFLLRFTGVWEPCPMEWPDAEIFDEASDAQQSS